MCQILGKTVNKLLTLISTQMNIFKNLTVRKETTLNNILYYKLHSLFQTKPFALCFLQYTRQKKIAQQIENLNKVNETQFSRLKDKKKRFQKIKRKFLFG